MAAILQFQNRSKAEKPEFTHGHSATILIFTGVRFERIDFDALKNQAVPPDGDLRHASPARLAN